MSIPAWVHTEKVYVKLFSVDFDLYYAPYMSDSAVLSHFNNLMRAALLQW